MSKAQKKANTSEFQEGKLYLKRDDVWAIDYGSPDYIIVFIRDTSFKVQPENLVLIGDLISKGFSFRAVNAQKSWVNFNAKHPR